MSHIWTISNIEFQRKWIPTGNENVSSRTKMILFAPVPDGATVYQIRSEKLFLFFFLIERGEKLLEEGWKLAVENVLEYLKVGRKKVPTNVIIHLKCLSLMNDGNETWRLKNTNKSNFFSAMPRWKVSKDANSLFRNKRKKIAKSNLKLFLRSFSSSFQESCNWESWR